MLHHIVLMVGSSLTLCIPIEHVCHRFKTTHGKGKVLKIDQHYQQSDSQSYGLIGKGKSVFMVVSAK